jgi:hypothetical protein
MVTTTLAILVWVAAIITPGQEVNAVRAFDNKDVCEQAVAGARTNYLSPEQIKEGWRVTDCKEVNLGN